MKIIKYLHALILVLFFVVSHVNGQVSFTVTNSNASPNTARATASLYTIQLNAITSTSLNFDISITFTTAFILSSVSQCSLMINNNLVSSAVCSLNSVSNAIIFKQINNVVSINNITITFRTSTALYASSFLTSISYFPPGTTVNAYNTNSAPIIITNAPMTSCSLLSTSNVVGATANFSISYVPSVFISSGSILQIQFPAWSAYSLTNFPSFTSSSVCGGACTIRIPNTASSLFNEIITYSSLFSINTTSGQTLGLQNARNPASTQPITFTLTILHFLSSTSQPSYMTCSNTFTANTPSAFKSASLSPSNLIISASSTISLLLNLNNPISSISYLTFTYSSDIGLAYSWAASNQATTQRLITSTTPFTFLIGDLTNSTNLFTSLFLSRFTFTNAPYGNLPLSITIQSSNLVGSIYYPVDTITLSYTFTPSSITSASVTALSYIINTTTSYNFTFRSINSLTINSKIILILPGQVTATASSTCTCSIASTCIFANLTSLLININSPLVSGNTQYIISINSIINPITTTPSSIFYLNTYYYNTSTPTDILTSSVTFTATASKLFLGSVSSSSLTVAENSTYTINFQNRNTLPANSYIQFSFPLNSFVNSNGANLISFKIGGVAVSGCSMSLISSMKFRLTNCILSSLISLTMMSIQIGNIINPYSTKQTSSLSIETFSNNLLMEYLYDNLSISMTNPTKFIAISANPTSNIVNQQTSYTFSITFAQQHYSQNRIIITFPASLTIVVGFQCNSNTIGVTISCFQSNPSSILVITLSSSSTIPNFLSFSVTNIQNAWHSQTVSFLFQSTTNDTTYYYVQKGTTISILQRTTLIAIHNPSNRLTLLSPSVLSLTITNPYSINAPNPSLLKLSITLPSQLTLTASTCITTLSGALCSYPSTSINTVTITQLNTFANSLTISLSCNAAYFDRTSSFTILFSYNNSDISFSNSLTIGPYCLSPCKSCSSNASFCTSCLPIMYTSFIYLFSGNNTCLSICPSTYYGNSSTAQCQLCDTQKCFTCLGSSITCTSCSSPKYLYLSQCLSTCPDTYYGQNNTSKCQLCNSANCLNCIDTNNTCTSCSSPKFLYQTSCLGICPDTFFGNSSNRKCQICNSTNCLNCQGNPNTCTSCSSPRFLYASSCYQTCPITYYGENNICNLCFNNCYNCTNSTYCLYCVTAYHLNPDNTCKLNCPTGYTSIINICTLCTNNCLTCTTTTSTCTSCSTNYILYNSTCILACPLGQYKNQNGNCELCKSPCINCQSSLNCITCIANRYLYQKQCLTTCPPGTFIFTSFCETCNSNCQTCNNTATNCLSCNAPLLYYLNYCYTVCPSPTEPYLSVCTTCVPPCSRCSSGPYTCQNCISNYSLFNSTCVLNCPTGHISLASICQKCTGNCLACTGTTNNCTSCSSSFIFFNNTCIVSCPPTRYNDSNSVCQSCVSPCYECTTRSSCVSCVNNTYMYDGNRCLSACPASTFIYTSFCVACDKTCQTCQITSKNCTSCNNLQLLYLNRCYTNCPDLTYSYKGICTTCVQPCATCSGGAFSCATCIDNFFLLNQQCLNNCPTSGYLTVNGSCIQCPLNCITCLSSIQCLICSSSFLKFQGGCIAQCPETSPIIVNQTCNSCNHECSTCSQSPDKCIQCRALYFRFTYTCVQSCPITYYANAMTFQCESGLLTKIVFFPIIITYIIAIIAVGIIKAIFSKQTSYQTVITALSGWFQIPIAAFLFSLLFNNFLQPDLNYDLPKAIIAISFVTIFIGNILHFKFNMSKIQVDQYAKKWQDINVNHTYFQIIRILSLCTHNKFFRIIYSKIFGSLHFSLVAKAHKNIFTISTIFTIYTLLFSQIPLIIASFYLAYNKVFKDQIFYTSVQCLLINIISIIISLIDIYKPLDYFQDTQFMETKRYLEKVNNESLNKIQDQYRSKDQGSIDGEKYMGTTGGKFIFSKRDPNSMNQMFLQQGSAGTDIHYDVSHKFVQSKGLQQIQINSQQLIFIQDIENQSSQTSPKSHSNFKNQSILKSARQQNDIKSKINIFEPIQQQQAQYYEVLKYDESDFKTAVKIQEEEERNESQQECQLQIQRKDQYGAGNQDDNISLIEYRQRKEKWNQMIEHRKKLAHNIFNTVDTKQLNAKQLQKIQDIEEQDNQDDNTFRVKHHKIKFNKYHEQQEQFRHNQKMSKNRDIRIEMREEDEYLQQDDYRSKKRRIKKRNNGKGKRQLEQIYLQRLAQKMSHQKKPNIASSKSYKYQF